MKTLEDLYQLWDVLADVPTNRAYPVVTDNRISTEATIGSHPFVRRMRFLYDARPKRRFGVPH